MRKEIIEYLIKEYLIKKYLIKEYMIKEYLIKEYLIKKKSYRGGKLGLMNFEKKNLKFLNALG